MQKPYKVRLYQINSDGTKGELQAELTKMKETTITNGEEVVYSTGGDSNAKFSAWSHSKATTVSGSNAAIQGDLLALQTGTEVQDLTNTTLIEKKEILTVAADKVITSLTATGTAGSEIKYVYELDSIGNRISTLTQAAAVAAGVFTYTTGTKTITFNAGELTAGTNVEVIYYPTTSSAKQYQQKTDAFSATCYIVMDAFAKDFCSEQLIDSQMVIPKAKVMGNFELGLAADGNVAVHNFEIEALGTCVNSKLFDLFFYLGDDQI
jgi:hypothetical protein